MAHALRVCVHVYHSGWVIVAWIWSAIWYFPLDLIKWAGAYILNEDGFRDQVCAYVNSMHVRHGRGPAVTDRFLTRTQTTPC